MSSVIATISSSLPSTVWVSTLTCACCSALRFCMHLNWGLLAALCLCILLLKSLILWILRPQMHLFRQINHVLHTWLPEPSSFSLLLQGWGSPQLYYHDCLWRIPGHTTRATPVECELETNCFQFYAIANLDKSPRRFVTHSLKLAPNMFFQKRGFWDGNKSPLLCCCKNTEWSAWLAIKEQNCSNRHSWPTISVCCLVCFFHHRQRFVLLQNAYAFWHLHNS